MATEPGAEAPLAEEEEAEDPIPRWIFVPIFSQYPLKLHFITPWELFTLKPRTARCNHAASFPLPK